MGIRYNEHPPSIVAYDEPDTAVKQYMQCPEKVSECPVKNRSSLTMENVTNNKSGLVKRGGIKGICLELVTII